MKTTEDVILQHAPDWTSISLTAVIPVECLGRTKHGRCFIPRLRRMQLLWPHMPGQRARQSEQWRVQKPNRDDEISSHRLKPLMTVAESMCRWIDCVGDQCVTVANQVQLLKARNFRQGVLPVWVKLQPIIQYFRGYVHAFKLLLSFNDTGVFYIPFLLFFSFHSRSLQRCVWMGKYFSK